MKNRNSSAHLHILRGLVSTALVLMFAFLFLPPITARAGDVLPGRWQYFDTWLKNDNIVEPDHYEASFSTSGGIYSPDNLNKDLQSDEDFYTPGYKDYEEVRMWYSSPDGTFVPIVSNKNFEVQYEISIHGSWLSDGTEGNITVQLPVPVNCDPQSAYMWRVDTCHSPYGIEVADRDDSEFHSTMQIGSDFLTVTVPYRSTKLDSWAADNKWDPGWNNFRVYILFHRHMGYDMESNGTQHWYVCKDGDGYTWGKESHNFHDGVCSVCSKKQGSSSDDKDDDTSGQQTKVDTFKNYKVIGKNTAEYVGSVSDKKKTAIRIADTIKGGSGTVYKVVSVRNGALKKGKVKTLIIGKNVKTIGDNAFSDCTGLVNVTVGSNVTTIGDKAFYNTSIKNLSFPAKTYKFGKQFVGKCGKLKVLTFKSSKITDKSLSAGACSGIGVKVTVKVTKTRVSAYTKLFQKKGLNKKVKVQAIKK